MADVVIQRIGVTGHRDLPKKAVDLVEARLADLVPQPETTEVVCSLAVGADSLVARALLDRGGSLHVVIPGDHYRRTFPDSAIPQYEELLARASSSEVLPGRPVDGKAFAAAGQRVVDRSDWLLAVWDGAPARGPGGTGDVVAYARHVRRRVEVVWPTGLPR